LYVTYTTYIIPGGLTGPLAGVWWTMGSKTGLEYEARNVCQDGQQWGPNPSIAKAASDMAAEGWTLVSCSHPSERWAVLVFSRPVRAVRPARGPEP